MPRQPRLHSPSGIYHVMMRGNEKKDIFIVDEDREKLLDILFNKKIVSKYKLFAYCLMDNHIHLVMREIDEDLALCLKRIAVSYACYFNKKYFRVGHLFQDRFKSECIESENHLLSAIRYVHNNPVKAKLSIKPCDYPWSSYRSYISIHNNDLLTDKDEILSLFSQNNKYAVREFVSFSQKKCDDCFIDCHENWNDNETGLVELPLLESYIKDYLHTHGIKLDNLKERAHISDRKSLIAHLKSNSSLSDRQIGRILGLDRNMVRRAK